MTRRSTSHDQLFKDLLRSFFAQLVELVAPELVEELALRSVVALNTELFRGGDREQATRLPRKRYARLEAHADALLWDDERRQWWAACRQERQRRRRRSVSLVVLVLVLSFFGVFFGWRWSEERARIREAIGDLERAADDGVAFAALGRLVAEHRVAPEKIVASLRAREDFYQVFNRGVGGVEDGPGRAEVVIRTIEVALPLVAENPESFELIASMVWALDAFAGQHPRWLALRNEILAPLRSSRPPPDLESFPWVEIPETSRTEKFMVGSPEGFGENDERPQHEVYLSAFRLLQHEVTNAQFRLLKPDHQGLDDLPVIYVDWYTAYTYAAWLGGRLPTEAEWEYAARAGCQRDGEPWDYCDRHGQPMSLDAVSWYRENSNQELHPIGQKEPNPWQLVDMYGNAREWTADWFEFYSADKQENPAGPPAGARRVIRGGSFWDYADGARAAYRYLRFPGIEIVSRGFRVALPPPSSKVDGGS